MQRLSPWPQCSASKGYIVVAPNYAGYDSSTLDYHPYLIADQQSKDMIDALTAARTALPLASATLTQDNGQLFITGYSQVAMWRWRPSARCRQRGCRSPLPRRCRDRTRWLPLSTPSFSARSTATPPCPPRFCSRPTKRAYGNIYGDPADLFEAQYADGIETLLPTTTPRSQLYAQGKLPEFELFSATPPAPQFAADTPATTPADLAEVFALGFGPANLLKNTYRLSYLQDASESRRRLALPPPPVSRRRLRVMRGGRRSKQMMYELHLLRPPCCAAAQWIRWSSGSIRR